MAESGVRDFRSPGDSPGEEVLISLLRRVLISLTLVVLLIVSIGLGIAVATWPRWHVRCDGNCTRNPPRDLPRPTLAPPATRQVT